MTSHAKASADLAIKKPSGIPGIHIVANFNVKSRSKLETFEAFRAFIQKETERFRLTSVGEVYHNFPNGGYTGVVCLTESHLSIHTWPENNYLTFDIFLSNYLNDNRPTTAQLYENVKRFFEATVVYEKILNR
ncbi:MAG TPA: S-adenosylmethionine decarboxylase [Chryseosolibacter sp.]